MKSTKKKEKEKIILKFKKGPSETVVKPVSLSAFILRNLRYYRHLLQMQSYIESPVKLFSILRNSSATTECSQLETDDCYWNLTTFSYQETAGDAKAVLCLYLNVVFGIV